MPKAADLKKGDIVEIDDQLYLTKEIEVRSPSSRGANTLYKVKFMQLQKKQKYEQTFTGTDFIKQADTMRRMLQYLYKDDHFYTFMDNEDYNQYTLTFEDIAEQQAYLADGLEHILGMIHEGSLISIELPTTVALTIINTTPAIKGASASARTKPASLNTGLVVQIPEYLEQGEMIKVNTASGKFISRA